MVLALKDDTMISHSTNKEFLDLEIHISPRQGEEYPVEITLGSGQKFLGCLSADSLSWVSSGDPVTDGQKLFEILFKDKHLREAWGEARGKTIHRRIRLYIDADASDLHALPWELLRDGDVMLSANVSTPFSRYLAVSKPWGDIVERFPIRVLVVISNPADLEDYNLAKLDVNVERTILEDAFLEIGEGEILLDFLDSPATLEHLAETLQENSYHVLHYVGHGKSTGQRQRAALYLQDSEGNTNIVHGTDFIEMLARQSPQARPHLVFLAACQSAARSPTNTFRGLAPSLVNAGVPAVVAMQGDVTVETVRRLSRTFYRRLVEHGVVDCALNEARNLLLTAGRPDVDVPVLFMCLRDGRLWETSKRFSDRSHIYRHSPPPDPDILPDSGPLPPGSRVPFSRNRLFTGRVEITKSIGHAFLYDQRTSTIVIRTIQGMAGVGKTQLAVEFAYRYGRYFHGVHWINAVQTHDIDNKIAALGADMALPNWPSELPNQVALTLSEWRRSNRRLVILDDLEDIPAAREWLRRFNGIPLCLLITTRRANWPFDIEINLLQLETFTLEESCNFLRQYLPEERTDSASLEAIAQRLGRLPLALELAGRYLAYHPHLTMAAYLERLKDVWNNSSMQQWREDLGSPTNYDLNLANSFALNWEQVHNDAARRLFLLAGYCAPDQPIPYELLEQASGLTIEACDEALCLLTDLGLLMIKDHSTSPFIHSLLAEYVCSVLHPKLPLIHLISALRTIARRIRVNGLPVHFTYLRPHIEAVIATAEAAGIVQTAALCDHLCHHLKTIGDYTGAQKACERALAIAERFYKSDDPEIATCTTNLGHVLKDQGKFKEATDCFERALLIDLNAFGSNHPNVARDMVNLGWALKDQNDAGLSSSQLCFGRALKIKEATYGPNDRETLHELRSMGWVLKDQGKMKEAIKYFERAMLIYVNNFGPDHPVTTRGIRDLGWLLKDQDDCDLAGARLCFCRSLMINEENYGPNHPKIVPDINGLGHVLHKLGELKRAREYFTRALRIDEGVFGSDHPNVALDANSLGQVLCDLGELDKAQEQFGHALRILRDILPAEHRHIKMVQQNLDRVTGEADS